MSITCNRWRYLKHPILGAAYSCNPRYIKRPLVKICEEDDYNSDWRTIMCRYIYHNDLVDIALKAAAQREAAHAAAAEARRAALYAATALAALVAGCDAADSDSDAVSDVSDALPASILQQFAAFRSGMNIPADLINSAKGPDAVSAFNWWLTYGDTYSDLQAIAIRITAKQPSASPCERMWSSLEFTLTKRRCRLKSTTLGKLLYVRGNLRALERIEEGPTTFAGENAALLCEEESDYDEDDIDVELDKKQRLIDAADAQRVQDFFKQQEVLHTYGDSEYEDSD